MSHQKQRHLRRQPVEEAVRLELSRLISHDGEVDVQRMSYAWRADDLLVAIQYTQPIGDMVLSTLRSEVARKMHNIVTPEQPCQEWLVVIRHAGEIVARITHDEPWKDK